MIPTITTQRLILKPFTKHDAPLLYSLDKHPKVHKYLGNQPVTTLAQSEAMLQSILKQYNTNNIGRLAVYLKTSDTFIGWSFLKLEDAVRKNLTYYDIGYRFIPEYWGYGYATETALASIQYGFNALNLKQISGAADENNVASNHVLQKAGLQFIEQFNFENTICNWYTLKNPNHST